MIGQIIYTQFSELEIDQFSDLTNFSIELLKSSNYSIICHIPLTSIVFNDDFLLLKSIFPKIFSIEKNNPFYKANEFHFNSYYSKLFIFEVNTQLSNAFPLSIYFWSSYDLLFLIFKGINQNNPITFKIDDFYDQKIIYNQLNNTDIQFSSGKELSLVKNLPFLIEYGNNLFDNAIYNESTIMNPKIFDGFQQNQSLILLIDQHLPQEFKFKLHFLPQQFSILSRSKQYLVSFNDIPEIGSNTKNDQIFMSNILLTLPQSFSRIHFELIILENSEILASKINSDSVLIRVEGNLFNIPLHHNCYSELSNVEIYITLIDIFEFRFSKNNFSIKKTTFEYFSVPTSVFSSNLVFTFELYSPPTDKIFSMVFDHF